MSWLKHVWQFWKLRPRVGRLTLRLRKGDGFMLGDARVTIQRRGTVAVEVVIEAPVDVLIRKFREEVASC